MMISMIVWLAGSNGVSTKKMENVVTKYDERIAELEHLLLTAEKNLAESERKVASLQDAMLVS